jgi:carboxyl-terminal processing protease
MPNFLKTILVGVLALTLVAGGFVLGVQVGERSYDENFQAIQQAWDIINRDYVEQDKVDPAELSQAAIKAMMDVLGDPYSAYLNPQMYQMEIDDSSGQFEGIGAEVSIREGLVTIIAPYPGSPAETAGIRAGDVILEVDGQPVEGLSLLEVITRVRGPRGSEVRLLIQHAGEAQPVTITVVRGVIDVPSLTMGMLGDIAYIVIYQFGDRTNAELGTALVRVQDEGALGIVLDLRNNPGGGLQSVIDVASRFITSGEILRVRYNDGSTDSHPANRQDPTTSLPMVVLVNGGSASASEVLAGALQDHGRALIAGQTTFGKGSVNYLVPLAGGSALYITAARWLTPDGHLIEGQGITPDQMLEGTQDWTAWAVDYLTE